MGLSFSDSGSSEYYDENLGPSGGGSQTLSSSIQLASASSGPVLDLSARNQRPRRHSVGSVSSVSTWRYYDA